MSQDNVEETVRAFRHAYRDSGVWMFTTWLGKQVLKNPMDLWIYQEILNRTKPDLIIETGTFAGGSAFFLASICDLLDNGRVVTIDIEERPNRPEHPRITYLTGSSVDDQVVAQIREQIGPEDTVMAILDSDHSKEHVLAELGTYAPLVSEGCYLIVEDTGAGEWEADADAGTAVDEFLADDQVFNVDRKCEKFLLTNNPAATSTEVSCQREGAGCAEARAGSPSRQPGCGPSLGRGSWRTPRPATAGRVRFAASARACGRTSG
jgi:cephalosporin hydroxylase